MVYTISQHNTVVRTILALVISKGKIANANRVNNCVAYKNIPSVCSVTVIENTYMYNSHDYCTVTVADTTYVQ